MNVCGTVYFTAHFVLSYISGINHACLSLCTLMMTWDLMFSYVGLMSVVHS